MNETKGSVYRIILAVVLVIALGMLFFENASAITGHATESTTSNVTIVQYLAIQMSSNLTAGIQFGNIDALPAIDHNATKNYNATNNGTLYYIDVSMDSNTNVTFCMNANAPLTSGGGDVMNLENETFAFSDNMTDILEPSLSNDASLALTQVDAGPNVGVGESIFYRFWLDVPVAQPVGVYNNTVEFTAKNFGVACS